MTNPSSYVNLDDPKRIESFGDIHEFSSTHITHCHGSDASPPVGSFLLGSSRGTWFTRLPLSLRNDVESSISHLQTIHMNRRKDLGLMLMGKVVHAESVHVTSTSKQDHCTKLHVEEVHPLELFSEMHMNVAAQIPYQLSSFQQPENEDGMVDPSFRHPLTNTDVVNQQRKTYQTTPDSPMPSCTYSNLGGGFLWGSYGSGENFGYAVGTTVGCGEYEYDAPGSFAFNYDTNTQQVINPDIILGTGVQCHDCYAYLGAEVGIAIVSDVFLCCLIAVPFMSLPHSPSPPLSPLSPQILAEVYYRTGYGMKVEAKIGGQAGYSANLAFNNPSYSGSKSFTVCDYFCAESICFFC